MLTTKDILLFRKDIIYFGQYMKSIENYDMIHLVRSYDKINLNSEDIYKNWSGITDEIKNGKTSSKLEMYIHIPFCEEFCDFCPYYKKLVKKNIESTVEEYVDYLIEQFHFYAPLFKGSKFKCLSVGGGTPSILSPEQIKKLFGKLFELFEFDIHAYKGIEFRPSSTSEDKLKAIKEVGFETIHFGVQSLDLNVLEGMNRNIDTEEKVKESLDLVKKYNFSRTVIHLIRGLKGDDVDKFIYTLEKICSYGVSHIKIYSMVTTNFYIKKHYSGDKDYFYGDEYKKFSLELLERIPSVLEKYNYSKKRDLDIQFQGWGIINNNYNQEDDKQKYGYGDITSGDINLFGFGPSARSFREGKISYEGKKKVEKKFDSKKKIYEGYIISEKDEMKRKIITGFREDDKISIKSFYDYFGKNIYDYFGKELEFLKSLNVIKIDGDNILFLEKDKKRRLLWSCLIYGREHIQKSFDQYKIYYSKVFSGNLM